MTFEWSRDTLLGAPCSAAVFFAGGLAPAIVPLMRGFATRQIIHRWIRLEAESLQ